MIDYHMNRFYRADDEGYRADIPNVKGRRGLGKTPEQALPEVRQAKTAWREVAKERTGPIRKPQFHSIIYKVA